MHFPKVNYERLPRLRVFTLQIPDGEIRWIYPDLLPDRWADQWADPTALPLTQTLLLEWLQNPVDLGLGVPSAVMDISYKVLLHPRHPLYKAITVVGNGDDIVLDQRLWNGPNP